MARSNVRGAPNADLSALHAVVPVRSLEGGKERLGFALDAEERETLILGMLVETLSVLLDCAPVRQIHVVSRDPVVVRIAERHGAIPVPEPAGSDLNGALRAGRSSAMAAGASAVLYMPADLPLLSAGSLGGLLDASDAALAAGSGRPLAVIAPADVGGGTNALLLSPPATIEPAFGQASLEAHVRLAAAADATVQLVADPALGFDLDTPDDLERLDASRLVQLLRIGADVLPAGEPA